MSRGDEQLRHQLSAALRDAIEQEGISQADLARHVGMSAKHVNQMVTGAGAATVMTWEFAAYALGYRWQATLVKESEPAPRADDTPDLPSRASEDSAPYPPDGD